MDLTLRFACLTSPDPGDAACGVIVIDHASARPIHEAGYYLGKLPSPQAAIMASLVRALSITAEMAPETLAIQCGDELLARQVTGEARVVDEHANEQFDAVLGLLLQLSSWQIRAIEPEQMQDAMELARRALEEAGSVTDLDAAEAPRLHQQAHTGVPQWTLSILDQGDQPCPARCSEGQRFAFGPDTPAGLCVHAALVALTDGPLTWPDPTQRRMTTSCPHCDRTLRLEKLVGPDDPPPASGDCGVE